MMNSWLYKVTLQIDSIGVRKNWWSGVAKYSIYFHLPCEVDLVGACMKQLAKCYHLALIFIIIHKVRIINMFFY